MRMSPNGLRPASRQWGKPMGQLRGELIKRHSYTPELTDRLLPGLAKAGADL